MNKFLPHEVIDAAFTFIAGLVPGALGAAVALAFEKTLTWSQRFLQLAVGIVVSFFAARSLSAVISLAPFVEQGFSFTVGLIALKATPKFIASAADAVGSIPGAIRDKIGLGPK